MRPAWHRGCFFPKAMLLPLLSIPLFFGGSYILLTRVLLLSVRTVVACTAGAGEKR